MHKYILIYSVKKDGIDIIYEYHPCIYKINFQHHFLWETNELKYVQNFCGNKY